MIQAQGKKVIVILVSFGLYLLIAGYAGRILEVFESNWRYGRIFRQRIVYDRINREEQLPMSIADLVKLKIDRDSKYAWDCRKYIDHYDPNVWQVPQHVLLMHKHGSFYYVTFGDGSQAILRYWRPASLEETGVDRSIKYLYAPPYLEHCTQLILFGAIAFLIASIASKKLFWAER